MAAGRGWARRAPAAADAARPAEHAIADAGGDARVRRQRPLDVRAEGRRRAVAARRGEHRGVDGRAARRGARPGRGHGPTPSRSSSARRRQRHRRRSSEPIRFERGLSLDEARDSDAVLAYAMNGEPLPVAARLSAARHRAGLVRGRVGEVAHRHRGDRRRPSKASSRQQRYCTSGSNRTARRRSSRCVCNRCARSSPSRRPMRRCRAGDVVIRGVAWSGAAPIAGVEVRRRRTDLGSLPGWSVIVAGTAGSGGSCITRFDDRGCDEGAGPGDRPRGSCAARRAEWNRLGYGGNAIQTLTIHVR